MNRNWDASQHWVNTYLLSITSVAWILLSVGGAIYASCICDDSIPSNISEQSVKLLSMYDLWRILCKKSYEIFGRITIYEDRLVLTAPLRKQITYMVSEIKYIQIDYNLLSINKQFWVVIGPETIPSRYIHKVNEMPITQNRLKIQYTPVLDKRLEQLFTGRLSREYSRAKSTLRAHRYS